MQKDLLIIALALFAIANFLELKELEDKISRCKDVLESFLYNSHKGKEYVNSRIKTLISIIEEKEQ